MALSPAEESLVLLAATEAAATKMCSIVAREDCAKVLMLHRRYPEARLLEAVDDETYGAIIARATGPAKGPKTPKGEPLDLDAEAKRQS